MHNMVLFCCASEDTSARIAKALERDKESDIFEAIPVDVLEAMYADACAMLPSEQELLLLGSFRAWANALTIPFINKSERIFAASEAEHEPCICISTANSKYIHCWRKACGQQGIGLRIVYVRDATALASGGAAALREFQCATHVALQAVPGLHDIAVFDLRDLDESGLNMRRLLLGQAVVVAPEMYLSQAAADAVLPEELPLELQLAHAMFKSLRLGKTFVADTSPARSRELDFLELACHPTAALARMDAVPATDLDAALRWRYSQRFAALCDRLEKTLHKVRQMKNLRVYLREALPYNVRAADVLACLAGKRDSLPTVAAQPAPTRVGKQNPRQVVVLQKEELTPTERKLRKFKRDPVAYFRDSKNPLFRVIGAVMQMSKKKSTQ